MKLIQVTLITSILALFLIDKTFAQVDYNDIDYGVQPMPYSSVGTVGWQFLKLHTNARTAAMAGVISSIGYGNANASLTNPASLVDISNFDISLNHMNWVADISYNSISTAINFHDIGIFGLHMIYVNYGEEPRTEYLEEQTISEVIYKPVLTGLGTVGANDLALGFSYARKITNRLSIGGNIRYLEQRIDDAKTRTWAIDIGTFFYTGFKSLRISMLGKNFGPDSEFRSFKKRIQTEAFSIKLPMQLWMGAAMDIIEKSGNSPHHVIFAMDYLVPNDGDDKINLGAEYTFNDVLVLRGGYRFNYDVEGLTFGGGIKYKVDDFKFQIDYAYIDTGIFGNVNMFSFLINM